MTEDLDTRREELYELNTRAWSGDTTAFPVGKLDASLKKNTAFIKKVRISLNGENVQNIIKDISTITLEKYLSEIISAITEGLVKCVKNDDVSASMEIISALHQRFSSKFTPSLLINFLHGLANPPKNYVRNERDDTARVNRQRILLKLLTEFYMIGIFRTASDCPKEELPEFVSKRLNKGVTTEAILITVLKEILNYDISSGISITIATSFLKRFSPIIYDDSNPLLTDDVRSILQQIFKIYSSAIFERTKDLHKRLNVLNMRNKKISVRTGRLLEDITQEIEMVEKLFEKFKLFSEYLSELLDVPMPLLVNSNESTTGDSMITEVVTNKTVEEDLGFWESLEVKGFYQPIPELSSMVSTELLEAAPAADEVNLGDAMTGFVTRLENAATKQEIDELVNEFWILKLNNKASRNRLYKFFIETPEINKLKFYARFMAINRDALATLLEELIIYLDKGFRSQIHHNRLNFKNITFFCECVKFKLVPTHVIFHKIRTLIINITSTNNIDVLGVFFEQVGRFLLHEEEYKELMEEMLALLNRKRKNDKLTLNDKMAIDGLLLTVNPPPIKTIVSNKPLLTPVQQFIKLLIRKELDGKNWEKVFFYIKKVDLKDTDNFNTLKSLFSKPDKINYENITYLAKMLASLSKYSKFLMISVIDTVLENFQRGLEINDYRFNRIRVSQVKYLGEMFNHKILNGTLMVDLLYRLVITGHPNNNPMPNQICDMDLPDDYFRILLITTLVQTIDKRAVGAKQWEKLLVFIQYFEYYIFTKDQPIPKDTEFKIHHMIEYVDSDFERASNLKEAVDKLQLIIQSKGGNPEESDDDEDDDEDEEDEELEYAESRELDERYDEEENSKVQKISMDAVDSEYERKLRDEEEKKFEDDLDKEFQKMVLDSLESRKLEKSSRFNAPVLSKSILAPIIQRPNIAKRKEGVPFTLVTKVGKKTTSHHVQLATDTKAAASILEEEAKRKYQQEKIRNFVLNMED